MCAMPSATFFFTFLRTRVLAFAMSLYPQCRVGLTSCWFGLELNGGFARTLARARVGTRALTAYRQAAAMALAPIGAEIHQALDVHRNLAPQIALDRELADKLPQLVHIVIGQVFDLARHVDSSRRADPARAIAADAVNRGKSDLGVLVIRDVDSGYAGHAFTLPNENSRL